MSARISRCIRGFFLIAFLAGLAAFAEGAELRTAWSGLRDGVVYVRAEGKVAVEYAWEPAWAADGHEETIYFEDPRGRLLDRNRIAKSQQSGRRALATGDAPGDYRLEIPGFSYRYYAVALPAGVPSVFEPVKQHFSMEARSGQSFYFRVPDGAAFQICGKYHDGVGSLDVYNGAEQVGTLRLQDYGRRGYPSRDQLAIPRVNRGGVWRLALRGGGKVAFWLDGIPNYFAARPEDLFRPVLAPGSAKISVGAEIVGKSPKVGATMEFLNLPRRGYEVLARLKMNAANFYVFQDALTGRGGWNWRDTRWVRIYEQDLGIRDYLSVFTPDRKALGNTAPSADALNGYAQFMRDYVAYNRGEAALRLPYIAFFDEPNNRLASRGEYFSFFESLASSLRAGADDAIRGARIAAPESAGLINGPSKADAAQRIGADWVAPILQRHWDLIDAVSWHEWMTRDLIATEWYRESVERAFALVRSLAPPDSPTKDLIISQTNISSGSSLSPYEQDTFFAALWWASVVMQAGGTGKLTMINWLRSFDSRVYRKGLVAVDANLNPTIKPVGYAMQFVNKSLLPKVLKSASNSVEVDAMAVTDEARSLIRVLFVNKFPREENVSLSVALPASMQGAQVEAHLSTLAGDLREDRPEIDGNQTAGVWRLDTRIAGETIAALELRAP